MSTGPTTIKCFGCDFNANKQIFACHFLFVVNFIYFCFVCQTKRAKNGKAFSIVAYKGEKSRAGNTSVYNSVNSFSVLIFVIFGAVCPYKKSLSVQEKKLIDFHFLILFCFVLAFVYCLFLVLKCSNFLLFPDNFSLSQFHSLLIQLKSPKKEEHVKSVGEICRYEQTTRKVSNKFTVHFFPDCLRIHFAHQNETTKRLFRFLLPKLLSK